MRGQRTICLWGIAAIFTGSSLVSSAFAEDYKAKKDDLQGKWSGKVIIDEEALKKDPMFAAVPAEQLALFLPQIKKQFDSMSMKFDFAADGKATAESNVPGVAEKDKKKTGTWEVVKSDGNKLTVKLTADDPDAKEKTSEFTMEFRDAKTMIMNLPSKVKPPKWVEFKFTKG